MNGYCKKTGITEYYFIMALRCRITVMGSANVLGEQDSYTREFFHKTYSNLLASFLTFDTRKVTTTAFVTYCEGHLFGQHFKKRCHFLTIIVNQINFIDSCTREVTGIQYPTRQVRDLYNRFF